jgi:branched-chain amino acid transport system substrate-binding protein
MLRLLSWLLVLFAFTAAATAQEEFRIGVIVSETGPAAAEGRQQLLAVQNLQRRLRGSTSPALRAVTVLLRDDGSDAGRALQAAHELVEEAAVHALVCCTLGTATARVAPFLQQQRVLGISPSRPLLLPEGEPPFLLVLPPGVLTQLRAVGLDARSLGNRIALLAPDTGAGGDAAAALRAAALEAGLHVSRVELFTPGRRPLTPEGLLVAASQPSAVVVWGAAGDTWPAVRGLRERGFEGPVYVEQELLDSAPAELRASLRSVVPPVSSSSVAGLQNEAAAAAYRRESGATLLKAEVSVGGARTFDALELILRAYEQALAYQVSPAVTMQFRQALWDGLIGSGAADLAAGSYRFDGRDAGIALPRGLVGVSLQGSRLVPGPAR